MKASEARELSSENRINKQEMENVLSGIRGFARQGKYEAYFFDLRLETIEEINKLGYIVTSSCVRNETEYTVSWAQGTLNEHN